MVNENERDRKREGEGWGREHTFKVPSPEESWTGSKHEERMEFSDPFRSGKDFYFT